MKGQLFGLKAVLGSRGEGAGGFPGQRCLLCDSPRSPVGPGQHQPLMMPSLRQEGRKAQRDILCAPGLITAFIMLPKPREQPAPVPCVLLQLVSL